MFARCGEVGVGGSFKSMFQGQLSLSRGWQLHKAALFFCFQGFAFLASHERVSEGERSECGVRTPSESRAELCKHL